MICPECQETIAVSSAFCQHCGTRIARVSLANTPPTGDPPRSGFPWPLIVVVALFALGVASWSWATKNGKSSEGSAVSGSAETSSRIDTLQPGNAFHLDGRRPSPCRAGGPDASTDIDESDAGISQPESDFFRLDDVIVKLGPGGRRGAVSARIATGKFKGQVWDIDASCLGTPAQLSKSALTALAEIPQVPIYGPLPENATALSVVGLRGRTYGPGKCFPTARDQEDFFNAMLAQDQIGIKELSDSGGILNLAAKTPILILGMRTDNTLWNGSLDIRVLSGPSRGRRCWTDNLSVEVREK